MGHDTRHAGRIHLTPSYFRLMKQAGCKRSNVAESGNQAVLDNIKKPADSGRRAPRLWLGPRRRLQTMGFSSLAGRLTCRDDGRQSGSRWSGPTWQFHDRRALPGTELWEIAQRTAGCLAWMADYAIHDEKARYELRHCRLGWWRKWHGPTAALFSAQAHLATG